MMIDQDVGAYSAYCGRSSVISNHGD